MLDGYHVVGGSEQGSDDFGSLETLLDVQVTRWLVEHIPVNTFSSAREKSGLKVRTHLPSVCRTSQWQIVAVLLQKVATLLGSRHA